MTARTPLALSAAALACFAAAGLSFPAPAGALTAAEADGCVGGGLRGYCIAVKTTCHRSPNATDRCFDSDCSGYYEVTTSAFYICREGGTRSYCSAEPIHPCNTEYRCKRERGTNKCKGFEVGRVKGGYPGPRDTPC